MSPPRTDATADRERLPNRRAHELLEFEHDGFSYVAGIGRFSDGSLAEVFINVGKAGTGIETYARDAAITLSLLLQHGASLATIRNALTRDADGSARGSLGTLLDIPAAEAAAAVDTVGKCLR
jgi:ribonucleoside-diphosphate reductase alpha chain